MKKSEMLQRARGMLERKTKTTILPALMGCVTLCPAAQPQFAELKRWIESMLDGHFTYEGWLMEHHPDFLPSIGITTVIGGDLDCLPGRLAWMDWMIEYWQAEEAKETSNQFRSNHGNHPRVQVQRSHQSLFDERDLPAVPGKKEETPF